MAAPPRTTVPKAASSSGPDLDVDDTTVGRRDLDLRPSSGPEPHDEPDRLGLHAAQREAECSQRGRVTPLQVVDRHENAVVRGELAQRRPHRQAEREWIDRMRFVRVDPPERNVQRPGLGRGQIELGRAEWLQQLGEHAERKLGLGLSRPSGEDAEAQVAPAGDRLLQQRGLPVAGPAPEHERVVPLGDRPKEPVDSRELRVASDDGRHYSTES